MAKGKALPGSRGTMTESAGGPPGGGDVGSSGDEPEQIPYST